MDPYWILTAAKLRFHERILKNARTRILVADQSKFERNAPVRICNLSELDYVILDREPPEGFLEVAKSCGTRVVTGETAGV